MCFRNSALSREPPEGYEYRKYLEPLQKVSVDFSYTIPVHFDSRVGLDEFGATLTRDSQRGRFQDFRLYSRLADA